MKLAIVGNPNTGKSTVFQKLTGTSVSVGNLAGVTVDVAVAPCKHPGAESWLLHDLPGIYNLHAQTETDASPNGSFSMRSTSTTRTSSCWWPTPGRCKASCF